MAEASPKQTESMEDILQSIKRIIEDEGEQKPVAPAAAPVASDVLDLTQMLKEDGSVETIPPMPVAKPIPPAPPVAAAAAPPAPPPPANPIHLEDSLVSDQAAQAAIEALKPIVEGGQKDVLVPRIPSSSFRNGTTVEDLVLEALRPMLKAWLDENLPIIVHKIVEREVKRLVSFHHDA